MIHAVINALRSAKTLRKVSYVCLEIGDVIDSLLVALSEPECFVADKANLDLHVAVFVYDRKVMWHATIPTAEIACVSHGYSR